MPSFPEIPGDGFSLPSVPNSFNPGAGAAGPPGNPGAPNSNDIDFDDLAARFEKLKKKKWFDTLEFSKQTDGRPL